MRLLIDSRFASEPIEGDGVDYLPLEALAADVRRPRALAHLLWGQRRDEVVVVEDGLPRSAVQAGVLIIAALVRSRRFELRIPGRSDGVGRLRLLVRGLAATAAALPQELWRSLQVQRRAHRFLADTQRPPRGADTYRSVAYLRPAPTMRYLGRYVGGAAAHTTGVINGLTRNGVDVRVYAPDRPDRVETATVHPVPLRRAHHLVQWHTVSSYSADVVQAAASETVDFVYQRYVLGSYAGLELARRLEVPLVLEFNGSEVWSIKNWGSGRLPFLGTLKAIEQRNVLDASLVVVVSDALRENLIAQGVAAERVLANPNGVDVEALAPLRAHSSDGSGPPTIGFVGTFGAWHGVKLLPEMIETVAARQPEARWVLIGGGRLHAEVRDEIELRELGSRVELTGVLAHEAALERLADCDVCVSPHVSNPDGTRFFGSPTKLFEYMGLAKAIVAAELEQLGQVLEHERTALLHPPGDVDAAASAVVQLLEDRALRERLGAAALASAERTYSWDAHVRRIIDALENGVRKPALAPAS